MPEAILLLNRHNNANYHEDGFCTLSLGHRALPSDGVEEQPGPCAPGAADAPRSSLPPSLPPCAPRLPAALTWW